MQAVNNCDDLKIKCLFCPANWLLRFTLDDPARNWWVNWASIYGLSSGDPNEYLRQLTSHGIRVKFPLMPLLQDMNLKMREKTNWSSDIAHDTVVNKAFEYPDLFSVATASVAWSLNWHSNPDPRLFTAGDDRVRAHIDYFSEKLKETMYYAEVVNKLTNPVLKKIIMQRLDSTGGCPTITGDKEFLVGRVKDGDLAAATLAFRNLIPPQKRYIINLLEEPLYSKESRSKIISRSDDNTLSLRVLINLRNGQSISAELMSFLLLLYRKREACIKTHYDATNKANAHFEALPLMLFL